MPVIGVQPHCASGGRRSRITAMQRNSLQDPLQAKGGYTAAAYGFEEQQAEPEEETESEEEVRGPAAAGAGLCCRWATGSLDSLPPTACAALTALPAV